jgi:amidase
MHVQGLETAMGYVGWVETFEGDKDSDSYLKYESQIVQELRQLGAIPFAKASTSLTSGDSGS